MASLTGASCVITLAITNLFPSPQQLQGFSADDVYSTDSIAPVEVLQGVDGILSGGFVYDPIKQSFDMQADSESNRIFETWWSAMIRAQDVYLAFGTTTIPATGRSYVMTRGFLTMHTPMPSVGKLLKPRKYTITWQSVLPAPSN